MAVDMYKGPAKAKSEVATIYNPDAFFQKVNGKIIYKNVFFDPNNFIELVRVLPGDTTVQVKLYSDVKNYGLRTEWKEWNFTFQMQTEAGHAYYLFEEMINGVPAVMVRDLGPLGDGFDPPLRGNAEMFKPNAGAEHEEKYREYYHSLKSEGVPVKLTLVEKKRK